MSHYIKTGISHKRKHYKLGNSIKSLKLWSRHLVRDSLWNAKFIECCIQKEILWKQIVARLLLTNWITWLTLSTFYVLKQQDVLIECFLLIKKLSIMKSLSSSWCRDSNNYSRMIVVWIFIWLKTGTKWTSEI